MITESGGAVNLTSSYCSVCTGYNLSYSLPLSPYLADPHVTLVLEAAAATAGNRAPLTYCSTPYRRGPCPASNEIDDDLPPLSSSQHLVARSPAAASGILHVIFVSFLPFVILT